MVFLCEICNNKKEESEIIALRCSHSFCWSCISLYLQENLDCKNKCPVSSCKRFLRDAEVRQVISTNDIEKYEEICLKNLPKRHSCVLPDCNEITLYDDINIQFDCRRCSIFNCIKCGTAHKGMLCSDLTSKNCKSLPPVCQKEILRATEELRKRVAILNRGIIAEMEHTVLGSNSSVFVCQICTMCIGKGEGIIIRQCFHEICKDCFREHVKNCQVIPVCCPFSDCPIEIEDRECREILLGPDKEFYEMKCIMHASRNFEKTERCRNFDCTYICIVDKTIKKWTCPLCASVNCVACSTIHDNQTCQQYINSRVTCKDQLEIEKCIKEGKYMRCLVCEMLIMKTSGCNWIQCSACQTELCWINQTHRWGPKGRGDISGGCKCGVNGKMCHPKCVGCIPHSACLIM